MDGTENTNTTTQGTETGAQTGQQSQQTGGAQQQGDSQQQNQQTNIEELISRAVDRATNKLGNENKKLRSEIETLKKAGMDAEEVKKYELSEKEKEIADREKALNDKTNRLFAISALEETGLKDSKGSTSSLVDFVMADSEEAITERVKAFSSLVESIVKVKVDEIFKANGRTPGVGDSGNGSGQTDSLAVRMGKQAAQNNQKARSVLDHYIGGK